MKYNKQAMFKEGFPLRRNFLFACIFLCSILLASIFLFRPFWAAEKGKQPILKGAMFDFLILISDLDRLKGDNPIDWKSVQRKIGEMDQNVAVVRSLDTGGRYDLPLRGFQQYLSAMNRLVAGAGAIGSPLR